MSESTKTQTSLNAVCKGTVRVIQDTFECQQRSFCGGGNYLCFARSKVDVIFSTPILKRDLCDYRSKQSSVLVMRGKHKCTMNREKAVTACRCTAQIVNVYVMQRWSQNGTLRNTKRRFERRWNSSRRNERSTAHESRSCKSSERNQWASMVSVVISGQAW